jgi:hypothetical protein
MSHGTPMSRAIPPQPPFSALQAAENEALHLLGGHARDPLTLTRIAIVFDLQLRRVAYRIIGLLKGIGAGPRS